MVVPTEVEHKRRNGKKHITIFPSSKVKERERERQVLGEDVIANVKHGRTTNF